MLNSFKCDACGTTTKAVIRPRLCPKCGARRAMLHKAEEKK